MKDIEIAQVSLDTPDGLMTFFDTRDIREVLEKYVGSEFASYITDMIIEADEENAYEVARANTDADAIAEENDYLRSQLLDTQNIIDDMANDIAEKQRINKQDLYHKLIALSEAINEVL